MSGIPLWSLITAAAVGAAAGIDAELSAHCI
jgi:hypothetical protein